MLLFHRRKYQAVIISHPDGDVVVTVTNIERDQNRVQLGFDAPRSVTILRSELAEREA